MTVSVLLKEYFAAAGSSFTKADAEVIGPQLEALAEAGPIDERTIVDVARSANSPLNRYFEWDDDKAADLYRVGQAATMMRSIRVRTIEDGRPRVTSAYKLVAKPATARPASKGYNVLHHESAIAAKMAEAAYNDLVTWRVRYASYVEAWVSFADAFRQVANQISEFEEIGKPVAMDAETDEALAALVAWRERFGSTVERWGDLAEQGRFMIEVIRDAEALSAPTGKRACPVG